MEAHYASETALFLGARPRSDVPTVEANKQPAFACARRRTCYHALSLGGGAARGLAALARGAALVGVVSCHMEDNYASETAFSLGEKTCSDVPAAVSNEQRACACPHRRTCHRALSFKRWRSTLACGVGTLRRAGWSRLVPYGRPLRERDGPLLRCTATLRIVSSGLQRAAGVRVCAQANMPPQALSWEVAQHAHLRRSRAAPHWLGSVHSL